MHERVAQIAQDIIGERAAGKAIEEIFNVFHPAPPRTELREIFTAETARKSPTKSTSSKTSASKSTSSKNTPKKNGS